jgi:hypothetical protein
MPLEEKRESFDCLWWWCVPAFRLFYFRSSRLERSETIEAPDPLTAVHLAAERPSADLVELWSDCGKIATFRPAQRQGYD